MDNKKTSKHSSDEINEKVEASNFDDLNETLKNQKEQNTQNESNENKTEENIQIFSSEKNVITEDDLFSFIGPKCLNYYAKVFRKHSTTENFASWNWASFLFTPFWTLYRKLYVWFFVYLVAMGFVETIMLMSPILGFILMIVLNALYGVFGNCMYLYSCRRNINKVNSSLGDYPDKKSVLAANGGTSVIAPFVYFLISLTFSFVIVGILGAIASVGMSTLLSPFVNPGMPFPF